MALQKFNLARLKHYIFRFLVCHSEGAIPSKVNRGALEGKIKKAIGAQRVIILLEFLLEAVVLSVIGGVFGLILVVILAKVISSSGTFIMFLSFENILWGVGWSILVGVFSGLMPALQASRLDPVEAIRK